MADGTGIGRGSGSASRAGASTADSSRDSLGIRGGGGVPPGGFPPLADDPLEGGATLPTAAHAAPSRRAFPLVDPFAAAPPVEVVTARRGKPVALVLLLLGAVATIALAPGMWMWASLPLGLLAGVTLARSRRSSRAPDVDRIALAFAPTEPPPAGLARPSSAPPPREHRALVLTTQSLVLERTRGERTSLPTQLPIAGRFGVTLLSNKRRDRLVAAVTSDEGAFLFATTFVTDERRTMTELMALSTVLGGDDHALDATGPDGASVYLEPDDFRALVAALADRDRGCFDRIVLSDQTGAPLLLDGCDLFVRDKHFDLRRPLEWRSILFQESFGSVVTLYQGTWIRQGNTEVVMVSLLTPSFFEANGQDPERAGIPELDVMATRDQRLLQATASDPPPTEQRIAMDGLFVVPLRRALDQAPRLAAQPVRSGHAQ